MVRLKAKTEKVLIWVCIFQFQYGTIKSNLVTLDTAQTITFQFQYGTIKSWGGKGGKQADQAFNSSMVRLKVNEENEPRSLISLSIPVWYD